MPKESTSRKVLNVAVNDFGTFLPTDAPDAQGLFDTAQKRVDAATAEADRVTQERNKQLARDGYGMRESPKPVPTNGDATAKERLAHIAERYLKGMFDPETQTEY